MPKINIKLDACTFIVGDKLVGVQFDKNGRVAECVGHFATLTPTERKAVEARAKTLRQLTSVGVCQNPKCGKPLPTKRSEVWLHNYCSQPCARDS